MESKIEIYIDYLDENNEVQNAYILSRRVPRTGESLNIEKEGQWYRAIVAQVSWIMREVKRISLESHYISRADILCRDVVKISDPT